MDSLPTPTRWPRLLFFVLVVRPLLLIVIGMNVRHRERLPTDGPAILAANHNSHLDTLALMCLLPLRLLPCLRPVAAADYFLGNRFLAWFATRIIGILPLQRDSGVHAMEAQFEMMDAALRQGDILILFPEGSRGEPEKLAHFKTGLGQVALRNPEVPVVPVLLHGFGKTLPKGEALLVPFFCDVFVGEPMPPATDRKAFVAGFEERMHALADETEFPAWD